MQQTTNVPPKVTKELQTINAILAPVEMAEKIAEFLAAVNASKIQNNVPNYCKDGETSFRYIVAFKQVYTVKQVEKAPTQGNRRFRQDFKEVTIEKPSKADQNDENFTKIGETEEYELKTEFKFVGWKEIRVVKAENYIPTEKILAIVFDAPEGLTIKNVMLYAIDTLAKKCEVAAINGKALLRMSSELHAFIPYKGETVNTMATGGGVPARFIVKDFSKFVDLFLKKLERSMNKGLNLLPGIASKLEPNK